MDFKQCKASFGRQTAEDEHYTEVYNHHYNNDYGFLPLYQLPSKNAFDIASYIPFKLMEAAGAVSVAYGILDKDPDTALIGGLFVLFGLLTEIGILPVRRAIRGEKISQETGEPPYKIQI